jgi:hypothetical protein
MIAPDKADLNALTRRVDALTQTVAELSEYVTKLKHEAQLAQDLVRSCPFFGTGAP